MKQESLSGFSNINITGGSVVICPDLFGIRHLGTADNLRGKIVRAFAIILDRVWPAGKSSQVSEAYSSQELP